MTLVDQKSFNYLEKKILKLEKELEEQKKIIKDLENTLKAVQDSQTRTIK